MIAPSEVEEIKRLLAEKRLSQRKIAVRLGVSRGTVHAIARGKRRDRPPREPERPRRPAGPPERCPGCGGQVYMPCLLCRARAVKERRAQQPPFAAHLATVVIAAAGFDSPRPAAPLEAVLNY